MPTPSHPAPRTLGPTVTTRLAVATAAAITMTVALLLAFKPTQATAATNAPTALFDVRDHGAIGDGLHTDTTAIQSAIDACAAAGGGLVRLPPGTYRSGTLQLRSHITFHLDPGARLVGTTNLAEYRHPIPPAHLPEAGWGPWHRALLLAENAEDITLSGTGTIDGNKVFDPRGEERMRGPHTFVFIGCRRLHIRDLTFLDAANYAVFFQVSDDVDFQNVTFIGGWDGIHWRGSPKQWCHRVTITGCRFFTGDDAIAGRYWNNTVISGCLINSSCNGIRLIGPATRLTIQDCLFRGPGEQPHRTSGERRRTNMLAAINLQPGAWDATEGPLDDVLVSDVTIQDVSTPFHIVTKPGNTAGRITLQRTSATGAYLAAASIEGWSDTPIGEVVLRDVSLEFNGGGRPNPDAPAVRGPGVDARPLPAWGLYARHVGRLALENVRLSARSPDLRPALIASQVGTLDIDQFRFPQTTAAPWWIVCENVTSLQWPDAGTRTERLSRSP